MSTEAPTDPHADAGAPRPRPGLSAAAGGPPLQAARKNVPLMAAAAPQSVASAPSERVLMHPCPYAGAIERSLELAGERCGDPAPLVYRRLFAAHPKMQAHFWRDENGLIKGEMLSRTFEAILDFVGPRRYADMMISAELVTHEGYDIPREIFATFFGFVRDAVQESLGPDWSPDLRDAWASLLLDIDHFVLKTPRSDTSNPYFDALRETFENAYAPP